MKAYTHPTAIVEAGVTLKEDVKIWHFCHVRSGAILQSGVSLAKDVFVDCDVQLGQGTRVQNGVSIYKGVQIKDWCFIGPHVIFTNDMYPRAGNKNWNIVETILNTGCSIGAGAIIRCGIELGSFSMIAAGSVVTKSVPPFHLAMGLPAKLKKMICACGQTQLPLKTPRKKLLRACCEVNLNKNLLEVAKSLTSK